MFRRSVLKVLLTLPLVNTFSRKGKSADERKLHTDSKIPPINCHFALAAEDLAVGEIVYIVGDKAYKQRSGRWVMPAHVVITPGEQGKLVTTTITKPSSTRGLHESNSSRD